MIPSLSRALLMLVVSGTSPITNLAAIGRLNLLHDLFGQITVPKEVRDELVLGGKGNNPGAHEVETESWFDIVGVGTRKRSQIARAYPALDQGEVAALALAVQRSAGLILLDDKTARLAADALGLPYVGVVGLLIAAKSRNLVAEIRPLLDNLRQRAGFRLADATYLDALRRAGE
jgi:uncharacterized protein